MNILYSLSKTGWQFLLLIDLDSGTHLAIESWKSFDLSSYPHPQFIFSKHVLSYLVESWEVFLIFPHIPLPPIYLF